MKKQTITLTPLDREQLVKMISSGQHPSRVLNRARVLLKADDQLKDEVIAQALDMGLATIGRVRRKYSAEGLHSALYEKPRPGALKKLDPKSEALLIATACSPAPNGRSHWALRLLAERSIELGLVEKISYETVRRTLKKTS